jgi:type VI secretion system protein ImpA
MWLANAEPALYDDTVTLAVFMIEVEQLLKPVSVEEPCGKNLSYDPGFLALEGLIAGKPETQFSAAEEPDWKEVRDACLPLLGQSKDLRVAVTLCLALVKLEGAVGLRDGLALLKGLLERYWPDLYPKLDPEENNDPLERINIIASVSTPLGTFGDPLRFLQRLREMPLANSPQVGWFSLADIAGDKITLPNGQEKPTASATQIKAAFRDTKQEELEACGRAILDSIVLAKDIDRFLMETVGPAQAPDMGALTTILTDIQKNLTPYTSKVPGQMQAEAQATDTSGSGGFAINGAIQSRQDVVRILDRICEYYARTEPSSPLPLLLRRAQRLAEMDFLQIVDELTPAMRAQLEPIVGVKPAEETPSPAT